MENYETPQCVNTSFVNGRLSYTGSDATRIPSGLVQDFANDAKCLDLSYNKIRTLDLLEAFINLEELILDNNALSDDLVFPHLNNLHTLSLNKNHITQLELLIQKLKNLPRLKFLSLHGNPVCPDQLCSSEKDADDYRRYRYCLLYNVPNLKFLDSTPVRVTELEESKRVGPYLQSVIHMRDTVIEQPTDSYSPLPEFKQNGKNQGTYGTCKYIYYGRHSEGNRFIRNKDL